MRFYNCKINKYQNTDDLSAKELEELGLPVPKAKIEAEKAAVKPESNLQVDKKEDSKKVDKK